MKTFSLARTKQCSKCPWKCSTNPLEIPDGYSPERHEALRKTIVKGYVPNQSLQVMACHHSFNGKESHCIGWLNNQMGDGNNINLRINMRNCDNVDEIKTYGRQHKTFDDTLPKILTNVSS